jgi:hypothetical protein
MYHYYDDYRYASGGAAFSVAVTFYVDSPCTTPATLYSSHAGVALSNPATTDSEGFLEFWSASYPLWYKAPGDTTGNLAVCVTTPTSTNVKDFGAVGNGVIDDTAAIQAAIDSVAASGRGDTIVFPPGDYKVTSSLTAKERVCLMGAGPPGITESGTATLNGTRIIGNGGFPIIEATVATFSFGVERMTFVGSTTASGSRGIYAHSDVAQVAMSWVLRDLFFESFADQAVFLQSGIAGTFSNIWIEGACYKRANHVTDYVGGFQLGDRTHWFSDPYMEQVTSTCSYPATTGGYVSGYHCGIALLVTAGLVNSCFGHMSETGWYLFPLSEQNSFTNCRADLNQGEGFLVDANGHRFVNCFAYRGGQDEDAVYAGFHVKGTGNTFVANSIGGIYGEAVNQLYGFLDDSGGTNTYVANTANAYISGGLNLPAGTAECYTLNLTSGLLATCTDSQTNYWGGSTRPPNTTAGWDFVLIPRAGTIKAAYIQWGCDGPMSTENVSLYLRLNDTTDTLIQTVGSADLKKTFENAALDIAVSAGHMIQIKNVFPSWATNPSNLYLSGIVYIECA